jgi:hypothetical protein
MLRIDEKLAELKLSKDVPDYGDLLSGFAWTREWFSAIEEVLLGLAFRDESDRPILDFIRAKIREIDIRSFNKILATFGTPPIKNHYDYIIENKHCTTDISLNNNDAIADYIIEKFEEGKISPDHLSKNTNDKIVKYLIANPENIIWEDFSDNTNDYAVEYCVQNPDKINFPSFNRNTNDKAVAYLMENGEKTCFELLENCNDTVVDYLLKADIEPDAWKPFASRNTNTHIVKYITDDPELVDVDSLTTNSNDLAVDFIFSNLGKRRIYINLLNLNKNIRVTQLLIDNPSILYLNEFALRTDDIAVDHIMTHITLFMKYDNIYLNSHDRVTEYIMDNLHENYDNKILQNNCNYNGPKMRTFNKLGLFPRIPHLQL